MFRTVSLSIIRSLALYTQQNLRDIYLLLCVKCQIIIIIIIIIDCVTCWMKYYMIKYCIE